MANLRAFAIALLALGVTAGAVGCSAKPSGDEGSASALSNTDKFDKNNVLDNESLLDSTHITHAELQRFLEKNPWGKRSALADYETPDGKRASVIMQEQAEANGVN